PDPLEEHRLRFKNADADAGMLAISADELIKKGCADWLRERLNDNALSDIGSQAIVSAFTSNRDLSALPEILPLSLSDARPEVQKSAQKAITYFLEDPATRAPFIERLIGFCMSGTGPLVLPSVKALGQACDLSSIQVLIPLVKNTDEEIRRQSVSALKRLTYQDFQENEAEWQAWWEKNKHLSRDRLIEPELSRRLERLSMKAEDLMNQRIDLALQLIESKPEKAVDFLGWDVASIQLKAAEVIHAGPTGEAAPEILEKVILFLDQPHIPSDTLKLLLEWVGRGQGKTLASQKILLSYLANGANDTIKALAAKSLHGFKSRDVLQIVVENLQQLKNETNRDDLKERLLELLASLGCGDYLDLVIHFLNPANGCSKGVRKEAARALGDSGKAEAIEVLTQNLTAEPENEIRSEIASSLLVLGRLGTPENCMMQMAVEGLKRGLLDREPRVKIVCINGIGELRPPNGLEILREHLLRSEDNPSVRRWYIKAVGSVGDAGGLEVICKALPENSKGDEANITLFEESQRAVGNICGEDLALWAQAVEIFFKGRQFDLTISFCDCYLTRVKGKNGDDGTLKQIKIRRAESCYKRFMLENDLPKAAENAKILAEQLAPENVEYLVLYARSLAKLERHKEASELYDRIIQRYSADPGSINSLWQSRLEAAQCHLALGEAEWVRKCFEGVPDAAFEALPPELRKSLIELRSRAGGGTDSLKAEGTPVDKPLETVEPGMEPAAQKKPPDTDKQGEPGQKEIKEQAGGAENKPP
ncbi:MAG: HEAT repeat domain-containing protein, partial [Planctomycetota bacterium]